MWGMTAYPSRTWPRGGRAAAQVLMMCEMSMGKEAEMDALVASAGLTEDTWVTADGQHIKYADLTDSHLHNILNYLGRREREMHPGPTSEAASDAWDWALADLEGLVRDLETERDRRQEVRRE